jgi:diketogulonate reductase-like aldo/keto reductase
MNKMASYQLFGLGTYKLQGDLCINIVKNGLELGYRQIDTAQLYNNHNEVSLGISQSGIKRDEIFLISKIHNSNIKKIKIAESIYQIKKELNTDYLDLILLHNPVKNYKESWKELILCKEQMGIKHIGVSNFNIIHLEKIIDMQIPWLNQIELNIFNQQNDLIKYHKKNNIITQAHTILTKGNFLNDVQLIDWSSKLNIPNYELMFKYVIDQNIGILQRTSNLEHLILNWNICSKQLLYNNSFMELNKHFLNKFRDESNYVKIYG